MHGRGDAAEGMSFVIFGIGDGPGQGAGASVAAAIEQAAEAAKDAAERDAGGEDVGNFPDGLFFPEQIAKPGQSGADEAAVIDEAAVLHHEDFGEGLVGELGFPIGGYINRSRTDDAAGHEPEGDVGDDFTGDVDQPGPARGGPESREKRQGHHHAVPADGQRTNMKGNRMHTEKVRGGGGKESAKRRQKPVNLWPRWGGRA